MILDASLFAALSLGFLLGLRHAMEADHVAAMSTFVSQERTLLRSCLRGTFWGIGHTAALLASGVVVIAFEVRIPPAFERLVDIVIALVLVALGAHVLLRARTTLSLHSHEHHHDGVTHRHVHVHSQRDAAHHHRDAPSTSHGHVHLFASARRPLLLGLLHGLGGGGALVLVVLTTLPSPAAAFLYLLVFGLGSTAGMLVLSALMGLPFTLLAGARRAVTVLQILVGTGSVILGLVMLTWA
jgi:high-affinity nickel permease